MPRPDYAALARYLLAPLVSSAEEIAVDCETSAGGRHVLVRVAFDAADRGKVFGKNGRTVHMIRTLLEVAAKNGQQGIDLDIYSDETEESPRKTNNGRARRRSKS